MNEEQKAAVRKYVNSNPPLHGKDIDFMGSLPPKLKGKFPKSATDTDVGSGRGRGDGVLGSGPGGAAAGALATERLAHGVSKMTGDPSAYKNIKNHDAVQAQKRSIDQLKELRAIYKNAFNKGQANKNKAKNKLKFKPKDPGV